MHDIFQIQILIHWDPSDASLSAVHTSSHNISVHFGNDTQTHLHAKQIWQSWPSLSLSYIDDTNSITMHNSVYRHSPTRWKLWFCRLSSVTYVVQIWLCISTANWMGGTNNRIYDTDVRQIEQTWTSLLLSHNGSGQYWCGRDAQSFWEAW